VRKLEKTDLKTQESIRRIELRPKMIETRHTFASWALAAGESPEWVARTLGHVDTTMVYRTYGCYIPNLTRKDGSAFERQYADAIKKGNQNRHNREIWVTLAG